MSRPRKILLWMVGILVGVVLLAVIGEIVLMSVVGLPAR